MQISILNKQRKYPIKKEKLLQWTRRVLLFQKMDKAEMGLVFVNNRQIRIYNRDYREKDQATDVLAFPMLEGVGADLHPMFMGDVMISLEMVEKEACFYRRKMEDQLLILLIHGILHLLGYDHERSDGEAVKMQRRERFLFKRLKDSSKG